MNRSYRRTRKEAVVAGLLWFGAAVWVISVSYWLGSGRPVRSIGGIPNWVVWGILVPWVTLFFVHSWYSLLFLRVDDDGADRPDRQASQSPQRGPGG